MFAELSATELKSALYRMLTGGGVDVGAAEDLARAGALGARLGLPVCAELLEGLACARPEAGIADKSLVWSGIVDATAALSAIDMLQAGLVETVLAEGCVVPHLAALLPLVLAPELTIETKSAGRRMIAHAGHFYIQDDTSATRLHMSILPHSGALESALVAMPINLDMPLWEAISERAAKSYVPATAASRSTGAGAGLTDND